MGLKFPPPACVRSTSPQTASHHARQLFKESAAAPNYSSPRQTRSSVHASGGPPHRAFYLFVFIVPLLLLALLPCALAGSTVAKDYCVFLSADLGIWTSSPPCAIPLPIPLPCQAPVLGPSHRNPMFWFYHESGVRTLYSHDGEVCQIPWVGRPERENPGNCGWIRCMVPHCNLSLWAMPPTTCH